MKILYAPHPELCGFSDASRDYWLSGELINGGVRKPNGKYLSVEPTGTYKEADDVAGSYEQIAPASDVNVLIVKPRVAPFKIRYVEQ